MSRVQHILVNSTPVQTSGGATVIVCSWAPGTHSPVVNNCILRFSGLLIGKSTTNEGVAIEVAIAYSVVSGTVTQLGSAQTVVANHGSAGITAANGFFGLASNIVSLKVTGVVGKTIDWTGWLEIRTSEF